MIDKDVFHLRFRVYKNTALGEKETIYIHKTKNSLYLKKKNN